MSHKPLVAIVDDDEPMRRATSNLLASAGFATATFPRTDLLSTARSRLRGPCLEGSASSTATPDQEIPMSPSCHSPHYELRFHSLFRPGRGYTFPCDAGGHVDLDAMSEGERTSYFYARAVIGHELSMPAVQLSNR